MVRNLNAIVIEIFIVFTNNVTIQTFIFFLFGIHIRLIIIHSCHSVSVFISYFKCTKVEIFLYNNIIQINKVVRADNF